MEPRETCDCGELPHRTSCPIEVERRALAARMLARVVDEIERRAEGLRVFSSAAHALGWYYRTREAWSTPRSCPLTRDVPRGGGAHAIEGRRRTFAAVAVAIRCAEEDERSRHPEQPAPIGRWLAEHHGSGRAYWSIQEGDPRWSLDQIKRRMARAHGVIERRLADGDWRD